MGILEPLSNLVGYSVPTIFVLAGMGLIILPFFKDMVPERARSARLLGIFIAVVGVALAILIKPPESQQALIPVYILPTPMTQESNDSSASLTAEIITTPTTANVSSDQPVEVEEPSNSLEGLEENPLSKATPTTLPTLLPATNTPTLEPVTSIIPVWGIEENGIRVDINASGIYKVEYLNDAYSPWPSEQSEGYRGWTTIVRIYKNRPVEWGLTEFGLAGPINHDDYLSPGGYFLEKEQAILSATGDSRTIRLQAGDYLVFVPLDEQSRYSDNQGKVDLGITYLGQ